MPLIRDLSDTELLQEWKTWDRKIRKATSWGAALGAADEFRRDCEREINRRNALLLSHKDAKWPAS